MKRDADYFAYLNRGESVRQSGRLPKELRLGYIPVDERSLSQLIVALKKYAKNLRYYNIANSPSGTWESLFENSDALMFACSIPLDTESYRNQFNEKMCRSVDGALAVVMELLSWQIQWMEHGKRFTHPEAIAVYSNVRLITRDKLKVFIEKLLVVAKMYNQLPAEGSLNIWEEGDINDLLPRFREKYDLRSIKHIKVVLKQCFDELLGVRTYLSREADRVFKLLLIEQCHQPATSLLLAFLQCYKHSQNNINNFPEKLMDYYYSDILGNNPEPGNGDSVFLFCNKINNVKPTLIAKGICISAGKTPKLNDMIYRTHDVSYITGTTLSAIRSVYLQRHISVYPENCTSAVTRIKDADLLPMSLAQGQSLRPKDQHNSKVNVFGFDDSVCANALNFDSSVGLYITSPLLYLKEGLRGVEVNFELRDRSLDIALSSSSKASNYYKGDRCSLDCKKGCRKKDGVHRLNELDLDLHHLARGLYSCLTPDIRLKSKTIDQLIHFVGTLDKLYLSYWQEGSEENIAYILKKLWVYLYCTETDDHSLGMIHGQLLSRKMFDCSYISDEETSRLVKRVQSIELVSDKNRLEQKEFLHDLGQSSFSLLVRYMGDAFTFNLSQEKGWLKVSNYSVSHLESERSVLTGFRIKFEMPEDVDPIVSVTSSVHGSDCAGHLPVMKMTINPLTKVFPYSYLQPFLINDSNLVVSVRGVKDICIHNDYGPVDVSKPFLPFSVIPQYDSRFYLGGFEYARKNIVDLRVRFNWRNLPKNYGGLDRYYSGYGNSMSNSDYKANMTMLSHGRLIPEDETAQQLSPLFSYNNNTQVLYDTTAFNYTYSHSDPIIGSDVTKAQYEAKSEVEHAYLCFRLRCSDKAFGHKSYAQIMSQALTHNARRRKQRSLPLEPYTPELESIEVDYIASDTMQFAEEFHPEDDDALLDTAQSKKETTQAYYITPLGLELAYKRASYSGIPLSPAWDHDGNCYFAFQCSETTDTLCIFFQFEKDATHLSGNIPSLQWRYFSDSGWKELPESKLMSDGTKSFMHSGIVNIELPQDLAVHPGLSPKNQFWLCASTSIDLRHYASFKMLSFDVIKLVSVSNEEKLSRHTNGFSSSWHPIVDIPSIQSYRQLHQAFQNVDAENNKEAQIRIFERLRHKNRAVTPWDYERITLERFPLVDFVKCLPACSVAKRGPAPGHVLIVVVPRLFSSDNVHGQGHHLNAVVLSRIFDALKSLCPLGVQLNVINATYEFIQVRCAVRFEHSVHIGEQISQLEEDISAYISPWSHKGMQPSLGWRIKIKDIESFIGGLPYVESVAKVSLVKRFEDGKRPQYYRIVDTASTDPIPLLATDLIKQSGMLKTIESSRTQNTHQSVRAEFPWSLPLPSKRHSIEVMQGEDEADHTARPVGINTLEVGSTFVIQAGS